MASIKTGVVVVISIVEAVAVCLDKVSLQCIVEFTRRFTAAAFLRPEPMFIGSNGSAISGVRRSAAAAATPEEVA
jgi:hypothetical protein